MSYPVHRQGDLRTCGAITNVIGQSSVYANGELISVDGDTNSHGGGELIADSANMYINGKLVVIHRPNNAEPDALGHINPATASGSGDVSLGESGTSTAPESTANVVSGSLSTLEISDEKQQLIDADIQRSISNPQSVGYTNGQVDSNYPATPDSTGVDNLGTTNSSVDPSVAESTATADQIPAFLTQVLQEAENDQWDETRPTTGSSNPNIIGIWKDLGFPETSYWKDDQTPWCAGFVNWVLKNTGYRFMQSARAYDFSNKTNVYGGVPVPLTKGQPGDIVVWDYSHVNFIYTVPSAGTYTFVGGNQSDKATTNNNPSNGSVTQSWKSGWTTANGRIKGIYRPVRG